MTYANVPLVKHRLIGRPVSGVLNEGRLTRGELRGASSEEGGGGGGGAIA